MSASQQRDLGLPVTERGKATRQALLDAAEEVFGELSFDRASVSEITRRAGVAQGTFYVYFPDKRAAFTELVRELNRSMRHALTEAIEGLEDRIAMERAGFRAFFDFIMEHRALYKLVREAEFVDIDIYRWHYRTLGERYAAGLQRAMVAGQIADDVDPVNLAHLLMGISEFMGSMWVILEHRRPPDDVFEQVMRFVERGVGARGAAA